MSKWIERERLPVSVSAAVLIENEEGKLLFLKQAAPWKDGKWSLPAGGMHSFESPAETAIREAKEETGLEVELVDIVGIYSVSRGTNKSGLAVVYRGRIVAGELRVKEGEIEEARYFSTQELLEMIDKGEIYKPEYNIRTINDWITGHSYPLEIIKKIR